MFTGIIQGLGVIKTIAKQGADIALEIAVPFDMNTTAMGDSIAVNGVCLTVNSKTQNSFGAFVSLETASKTNIKQLKLGENVNIEKALQVGSALGGHIVSGHIDTVGTIITKKEKAGSLSIEIDIEEKFTRYIVEKGSIAVDGISLTVNECIANRFSVNIIPFTAKETTLGLKQNGATVNVEVDIIGKYVEKLLQGASDKSRKSVLSEDFLAQHGYK